MTKSKVQQELEKEKMAKIRAQAQLRAQNKYLSLLERIASGKGVN